MEPQVSVDTRRSNLKITATGYEAVRVWTVIATSKSAAAQANGVGGRGHIFVDRDGTIPSVLCVGRDVDVTELKPSRPGQAGLYEVVTNYGSPSGGGSSPVEPGGPAVATWSGFTQTLPVDLAYDSEEEGATRIVPIVDRAGRPFDPPLQDDFPMMRLTLEWITESFDALSYYLMQGSINRVPFWGIPKAFGKIESIADTPREDGLKAVSLSVAVNPETWYYRLIDLLPIPGPAVLQFNPRFKDWSLIPVPT